MVPENTQKQQTKFKTEDLISCSALGRLIECSPQAARKLLNEKLTEGVSYLKDGAKILIDVESARKELRATIKASTCKNKELLAFLDLPEPGIIDTGLKSHEWIKNLDGRQIREELQRSELRLSLMQEGILSGKYIDRNEVYKNAEAAGIAIRNKFTGISARVVPSMMAVAPDIREADNILNNAIEEVLESLSVTFSNDVSQN